jgi:AcrR family transcriptional regulator
VTREQAAANRERILEVAGTLFRERGFDGIGVAAIMKRAGLTHGGFYGHFASKDDLVSEITSRVLGREGWLERLTGKPNPSAAEVVRQYLSARHRDDAGRGCLVAALGSDVVRQPRSVRRAFTEGLRLRVDALRRLMPGRSAAARRRQALATMAGLVGALTLSRAVDDPTLSDEILEAAASSLVPRPARIATGGAPKKTTKTRKPRKEYKSLVRRETAMRAVTAVVSGVALVFALAPAGHAQQRRAGGERLGNVHFETSCAPDVAEEFDHAMALLHSFEFADATTGFTKVLAADPSCGIAQWGVAMSTWGNPFGGLRSPKVLQDGLAAAEKAVAIGAKTDREREYIGAVRLLYKDAATLDHRARTLAYEKAMEQIYTKYPKDLEAAAFYALAVDQTAPPTDKTYANQLKAAAILETLYKAEPDHPGVTHYLIHSYDVPALAPRALPYARRYANLAPDAPHALHMPAHTFTRVGSWQESIDTNIRSHDVAMERHDVGEALHAWDYQMYAYLQTAQDREAKKILDGIAAIIGQTSSLGRGDMPGMPGMTGNLAGGWAATAIPARWAVERGAWAEAAALTVRPSAQPFVEAITHFARALGAARSGKPGAARADIDQLKALHEKEIQAKDAYWTTQLDIQRQAAEAWTLWAEGKKDEAVRTLTAAAALEDTTDKSAITPGPIAPAHELLGEMYLEANQPADALKEFEANLKKEPNRFRSVYGAGRAAESAGDRTKARLYYAQLLKICERGDRQRAELEHARQFIGPSAAPAADVAGRSSPNRRSIGDRHPRLAP